MLLLPQDKPGLTTSQYQAKMALLKTERQQKAKEMPGLFDIRQHYCNQIDQMAKEKVRSMPKQKSASSGGELILLICVLYVL